MQKYIRNFYLQDISYSAAKLKTLTQKDRLRLLLFIGIYYTKRYTGTIKKVIKLIKKSISSERTSYSEGKIKALARSLLTISNTNHIFFNHALFCLTNDDADDFYHRIAFYWKYNIGKLQESPTLYFDTLISTGLYGLTTADKVLTDFASQDIDSLQPVDLSMIQDYIQEKYDLDLSELTIHPRIICEFIRKQLNENLS